jgi:YD repeat-containing protein
MFRQGKQIVLIFITQIILLESFGQPNLSPTIPSPNAASLGQYGDLPVSHFSGVPDISIPIYTLAGNKIRLPVSLSYHGVGLRPDVHPSWVGNGWALKAGGAITRKMNQMMDEMQYLFDMSNHGQYWMRQSDWASNAKIQSNDFYASLFPLDVEPDEFDFNFLGYSGKFWLSQDGVWRVQCDKSIKVVFELSDLVMPFLNTIPGHSISTTGIIYTFGKFTLIDEFGTKYIFGSTDVNNTAIEFSGSMIIPFNQRGKNNFFATSWFLSQIISADGTETISLNYERGPFTSQLTFSASAYQTISGCGTNGPHSSGVGGSVVAPVYLTSISMPSRNVTLNFTKSKSNELRYTMNNSTMDPYVRIYQDAGYSNQDISSIIGTEFPTFYTLITSSSVIPYYAGNTPPTNFWDRFIWLKLNGIHVLDTRNGSTISNISFTYYETSTKRLSLMRVDVDDKRHTFYYNPLSLPNYLTIFGDHWGFNNEGNHSGNVIPPFTSQGQGWPPTTSMFAIREPDATGVKTQAEILTDIFYPTGGKVHIDYEPNRYSAVVKRNIGTATTAETGIAGGLRVKQITKIHDFGPNEQTNYYYVNNYTPGIADPTTLPSSGVLDSKPVYNYQWSGTGNYGGSNTPVTINQYQTNSVIPLTSNSMSNHIGYNTVVEKKPDGAYSIYQFSNHGSSPSSPYNDIPAVNSFNAGFFDGYLITTSNYFKRGKMLQKTDYTSGGHKVTEEINTFSSVTPEILTNAVHQFGNTICNPTSGGTYGVNLYAKTAYNIISTPYLPASTVKKSYSGDYSGTAVTQTTTYTYDQYKNLTMETRTDSKGQLVTTYYRYPYHFHTPANTMNPYTMMVNTNNVGTLIEKKVTVAGALVSAELFSYKSNGINKVYSDAVFKAELPTPVNYSNFSITTCNDIGDLSFDSRYKKVADIRYDATGNLTSVVKTGNEPAAYVWDYQAQYPTAKVVNANNVYGVTPVFGPVTPVSKNQFISNTKYITYTNDIYVNNGVSNGSIVLTFSYNNIHISGNNTSILSYNVSGITNPGLIASGSLCAATYQASCSSGSPTVTVPNLPAAYYRVQVTLVSVTGFDNYYGYKCIIDHPTAYQTQAVAANNEIAHTSFEYANANELTFGTGNISGIQLSNVVYNTSVAVTGERYYSMSVSNPLTKSGLNASKNYIVTYWTNGAGALSVTGTQSSSQVTTLGFGNWKCYQHVVANTSSITVSSTSGVGVDELRIYPVGSEMITYTYKAPAGMSSQCDVNNVVQYYEYDALQRLKVIRDKDKNIIKLFDYKY